MSIEMAGAKIIGGNGVRIDSDFYPTPREVTIVLLQFLKDKGLVLPFGEQQRILEPCCGEGAISHVLINEGLFVESHDIRFTEFAGSGIDYFSQEFKADIIITNPPFNLAERFIKKSLSEADIVCMLLKTQYWHASKRTKLFTDHPPAYILALTWRPNFFGSAATGSPTMDFIWTVWDKGDVNTKYRLLEKPNPF